MRSALKERLMLELLHDTWSKERKARRSWFAATNYVTDQRVRWPTLGGAVTRLPG
jgi:hypothetical protein